MIIRFFILMVLAVLSLTLFGCMLETNDNVLNGQLLLYPDQESISQKMKVSVFLFDSGNSPLLYPVDEQLSFSIPLTEDGEYLVYGLVENDECFTTESVNIIVKDGKIQSNKELTLPFNYTIFD